MDVRPLEASDYPQLREFDCPRGNKAGRKVERDIRVRLIEAFEENDRMGVLVAVEGDKVVGVVAYRDTIEDGVWEIPTLACHRDHDRQGIAGELKRRAVEECQVLGARSIVSYVHRVNTPMLALNRKLNAEIEPDPSDGNWMICVIVPEP